LSARSRLKKEESINSNGWLTTFNDLMTLLMVFFVLVFSMGTIDLEKSSGMIGSLQSGLGVLQAGSYVEIAVNDPQPSLQFLENEMGNLSEIYNDLLSDLAEMEREPINDEDIRKTTNYLPYRNLEIVETISGVNATYTPEGIIIRLADNLLFESGRADINSEAYSVLELITKTINSTHYKVRIEGHTDNIPIKTAKYPSNWELSIDRAIHVLKFFIQAGNVPPARLSAVGYGSVKPIFENNTAENRAQNRRVEIVIYMGGEK
jgi:chemotaxis protein MotB